MTDETKPPRAPDDFAFLDDLLKSEDLWVERAEEARALGEHILQSSASIVVLHGPARAGKSELIRRWLMPFLGATRSVFYRSAWDPAKGVTDTGRHLVSLADVLAAQGILLVDEFEQDLMRSGGTRGEFMEQLAHWAAGGRRGGQVVLILQEDYLSHIFRLREEIPGIAEDVHEMPRFLTTGLARVLERTTSRCGIRVSAAFLDAVARDLTAVSGPTTLSPELVAVLTFELRRSRGTGRELGEEDYKALGGVVGMLEAHLDFLCERLPNKAEPPIAWAVLEEAVNVSPGQAINLVDIANRFDVEPEVPADVLRWLQTERRVLRKSHAGTYDLVPGQLLTAVSVRAGREADAAEYSLWVLRQGVRHFAEVQALLSEHAFRRVHAHRSSLTVTDSEAGLMLRCALAYADPSVPGVTEHWSRRVKDPGTRLEILLDALSDSQATVRQLAVERLREFPLGEVRGQLHLLALRDPSDAVRKAAVNSLDAVKNVDLRDALIQEVNERTSPYRLQAIEALRIFPDAEAISALGRVIGSNTPAEEPGARAQAIRVLGEQEVPAAADALLDIALEDQDNDDREGAARALGLSKTDTLARHVLDRLRQRRRVATTRGPWPRDPVKAALRGLAGFVAALASVVAGIWIHGLLLAALRRFRLAVAVTVIEGVGIALYQSSNSDVSSGGAFLLLGTLAVGVLLPLRTLLVDRLESKPQGWFRSGLGIVLFAVCGVSVFLFLHGLASLLAKEVRRGLVLTGFEAVSIFLLIVGMHFQEEYAAFRTLSPWFIWLPAALLIVGAALFVTTFVVGVGSILLDVFVFRQRREALRRIGIVYAQMARRPRMPAIVLQALGSSVPADVRWGSTMVRAYGREMQSSLRDGWTAADQQTRRRVFAAMARRKDADFMEFLKTAAPTLGWRARARYAWVSLAFPLSFLPKPLLVMVALLLSMLIGVTWALQVGRANEPAILMKVIQDASEAEVRSLAIRNLRLLAEQQDDPFIADSAWSELGTALNAQPAPSLEVREELLRAIADAGRASRQQQDKEPVVDVVAKQLSQPDARLSAIATLGAIGSFEAVLKLKEFVELSHPVARRSSQAAPDEAEARKKAIETLGAMSAEGEQEALAALIALSRDEALTADLKLAAINTLKSFDALTRSEYALDEGRLDDAVREADQALLDRPDNADRQRRAFSVLAKAHGGRGASLFEAKEYEAALSDLLAGLNSRPGEDSLPTLVHLGLNLAFVIHEELAPAGRMTFQDVHDILSKLEPVATDPVDQFLIEQNLVEANLTTGRYPEALGLASRVLNKAQKEPGTALTMHWMIYAAHALSGNKAEADRAGRELTRSFEALQPGFQNNWTFAGTRDYIKRRAQPPVRDALLDALDKIERPR